VAGSRKAGERVAGSKRERSCCSAS
jgi:hypothetical protein